MNKPSFRVLIPAVLVMLLMSASGWAGSKKSHDAAVARNMQVFNAVVRQLEENYVDTIRTDEAFKAAIGAMLSTVDPYTEYFGPDDQESLMRMTTGEYGGIGSFILVRDSATYISAPYEGSPAAKAGLLPGDKILYVDSTDVHTVFHKDVSKLLRGQPGTEVHVKVQRPYAADSIMDITVIREKLSEPTVPYYGVVGDSTGYIRLTSYLTKSPAEVLEALTNLLADPKVESLVLDLRGNGGGLVESAVEILGFFLPKDTEVISTQGSGRRTSKTYKTRHKPVVPADMPLAVLIDGGSASASEITAGALQDLDRAVLVGTRSFGKGLVQSTLPLPFDGMLKVTVAKYLLPSGRLIQALDYSRRNPDGSVARTPDSLTNVYLTAAGREVRDGGGLTPDSVVNWPRTSSLLYHLYTDHKIFDYATRYYARHPALDWDFTVTDSIYADFSSTIDPATYRYKNSAEEILKELRQAVADEGYGGEEAIALLSKADSLFAPSLERDLKAKREEISQYLAEELAGRYYYDRGRIYQQIQHDPTLDAAVGILRSPAYRKILSAKATKRR